MRFPVTGILLLVMLLFAFLIVQIGLFIKVVPSSVDEVHRSTVSNRPLSTDDGDMFIFVQITDLHISAFQSPERYEQLKEFCGVNLIAIKPRVVLASGDLTDAMGPVLITGKQNEEEWKLYKAFYEKCLFETGILNWLDIRGNHDNFNVENLNSSMSFYPKYGAQRDRLPGSYMVVVRESNSANYAFVAVDAALSPGPIRPMNFIGELEPKNVKKLEEYQTIIEQLNVTASFWFGHYPSSSIMASHTLRALASKSIAYFCGHFHTIFGLVSQMYSPHHSGMLELELADWKDNRMYRIAVVDHGLFSFADIKHNSWPAIVVTNPRPLIAVQPNKEPYHLALNSTHIRLLIFSASQIELCEFRIDDGEWHSCQRTGKGRPLFTSPWNPLKYASGLHYLEIRARDASGSESSTKTEFALDGTRGNLPVLSRFILMVDITMISRIAFGLMAALCVVPGCCLRYQQSRILKRKSTLHRFKYRWAHSCVRGLWIYANCDVLFYSVSFYTTYLTFGPWFVGEMSEGRMGVVFVWGTIFSDYFLPGTLTYYRGFWHLLIFNVRIIAVLSFIANDRFQEMLKSRHNRSNLTFFRKYRKSITLSCLYGPQVYLNYQFYQYFGLMATLVNPMITWILFLVFYLWYRAEHLTRKELDLILKIWT